MSKQQTDHFKRQGAKYLCRRADLAQGRLLPITVYSRFLGCQIRAVSPFKDLNEANYFVI